MPSIPLNVFLANELQAFFPQPIWAWILWGVGSQDCNVAQESLDPHDWALPPLPPLVAVGIVKLGVQSITNFVPMPPSMLHSA